jgi:OOP family OmpA-OmpF porin
MKKLNKVAVLFASRPPMPPSRCKAFRRSPLPSVSTTGAMQPMAPWLGRTAPTNCWRDANWTPATGAGLRRRCQAAAGPPAPARAPLHRPCCRPPPAPAPAPAPRRSPLVSEKVTFAADAFFDVDKSVLKPEAKAKLDDLVARPRASTWKSSSPSATPTATAPMPTTRSCRCVAPKPSRPTWWQGHREEPRLHRRQGREAACGRQQDQAEGKAKNRRVEIEVVGTRAKK